MRQKIRFLLLVLVLGVPVASMAQTGMGSITGQVSDKSGAAIPGATVTVTNTATAVSNSTTTNASGIYLFQQLIPGLYQVEAAAPNFKKTVRPGVTLDVDGNVGINMKLEVGGTTETVTVTSGVPLLRNEDAQTGEVMNTAVLENFPNLSGQGEVRNVLGALQFAGDVQGIANSGGKAGTNLGINGAITSVNNVRVNGGRTSGTEYLVDGIPITQNMARQVSSDVPTIEDTSEFKVVTNGIGAQYGHLSGGAVDIVTQGGTNGLHGSFFDFSQAAALDANTWVNNDTVLNGKPVRKPGFHQNDYGIAIGGPVYLPHLYHGQKKTFWFFNYEGSRYNIGGNAVFSSVYNATERQGDESDMGTAIGDPKTPKPQMYDPHGPGDPTTQNRLSLIGDPLHPHDGMHIPQNYLDPIIQQYLKYMPLPNHSPNPGSATADDYVSTPKNAKSTDVYSIRVDENFSDKSRLFGRFTHNNANNITAPWWYDPNGKPLNFSSGTFVPEGFGAMLNYDYTFSPTLLLNLRAGGNYSPYSTGSYLPTGFNNSAFGFDSVTEAELGPNNIVNISGVDTEAANAGAPGIDQFGNAGFYGAANNSIDSTNIVYAVSLTKILHRHTLQFGYEGRRYYDNIATSANGNFGLDNFRFTSQATNQHASECWCAQGNANGVGDFLMGLYSWNQNVGQFSNALRQNYYAAYAQDDFKAAPRLTLSLGIRWETESPVSTTKNGTLTIWDANAPSPFTLQSGWTLTGALSQLVDSSGNPIPKTSPIWGLVSGVKTPPWASSGFPKGALELVGTPQHPSMSATEWHPYNFTPRFGAAWQVRNNTVIRLSFGGFYLPTGGALNSYNSTPGAAYSQVSGNYTHPGALGNSFLGANPSSTNLHSYSDPTCECIESPSYPGDIQAKTSNNVTLNQLAGNAGNPGAVDTKSHMPLEYNWSLGVQYEVKHGFLFEAVYNGNTSHDLLAKDNPGHFPASLFTGGPATYDNGGNLTSGSNAAIYQAYVPSPIAGASQGYLANGWIGGQNGTQAIGYLEYAYPYYGELQITNRNIGKSLYNALNLRVEHQLKDGFQILANYTLSRAMDNVGGPETTITNGSASGYGQGAKVPQDVQSIRDVYGLSTIDEPWRFTSFALYQLPIGRGRKWLNQHSGAGGNILDYAIGGWNISGDFITIPGSPITFTSVGQAGVNSTDLHFGNILGNFAPGATAFSLKNPHWGGPKYSTYDSSKQSPTTATPAFDSAQFVPSQAFTIGNLPQVYSIVRQPDNWGSDMSLSKNIPIFSADGARYLQIRVDDTNFLNHPPMPSYDTNLPDSNFGTIDKHGIAQGTERHIQLGARLVF